MGGIGSGAATGADVDLTTGASDAGGTNAAGLAAGIPPSYAGLDAPETTGDAGVYAGSTAGGGGAYAASTTPATNGGSGNSIGGAVRDQAQNLKEQALGKVRGAAEEGKAQVADTLDGFVEAARDLAGRLQDGQYGPVGGYAQTAADTLEGWARTVREKPVDDWLDDGRELIRRSPVVAAGLAVAAGFVLSRFLRAGGESTRYTA